MPLKWRTPYRKKTQRHYGLVYSIVRELGSQLGRFTLDDLLPIFNALLPGARRVSADHAVRGLVENGEVRVVAPGKRGRHNPKPTVYQMIAPRPQRWNRIQVIRQSPQEKP